MRWRAPSTGRRSMMNISTKQIGKESRAMFGLAVPVVMDQIGMMSMGFIDTIMVGRLGSDQLGAVGIGAALYFAFMVFAWGTIGAVAPIVAQAFGAGDREEIERTVGQGFWLALVLTAIGIAAMQGVGPVLRAIGEPEAIIPVAVRFVRAISFGMLASLSYGMLRSFTVGLGRTRITMLISFGAALVNVGLDYVLIYGKLGLPPLGAQGSGYATAIVQWSMFATMLFYVRRESELRRYKIFARRPDLSRIRMMVRLGAPIGAGNSLESGVFGLTSLLMGQIGTVALASHQIAINVASFTFMVPLGVSMAITTRVGQFVGRKDLQSAALAGWVGIGMAAIFMVGTALLFLTIPELILGIYTRETEVIAYASSLLVIAGAFQIFDGIQVAAQGALRGLKDTTIPMMTNLISYWLVGLPFGYLLAFIFQRGGEGLWWGLTSGLATAAIMHSIRFGKLIARSRAEEEVPLPLVEMEPT